jgi:hypothetical protein
VEDVERPQAARKYVVIIHSGDHSLIQAFQGRLWRKGFHLTMMPFASQPLDVIAALQPNLIVVELLPPGLGQRQLLDWLHQRVEPLGIPLLLLSPDPSTAAWGDTEIARYGPHAVLDYPLEITELLQVVNALVGKAD